MYVGQKRYKIVKYCKRSVLCKNAFLKIIFRV